MIIREEDRTYIQCDCCKKRKIRIKSRHWPEIQAGIMSNGWDRRHLIQGWQDRCPGRWTTQDAAKLKAKVRARDELWRAAWAILK
jgi:hypothetical protein